MDERHLAKKTRKEDFLLEAMSLLRIVIVVVVLVYLIPSFVVRPETIVGDSMKPTLLDGEKGLSNVFASLVFGIDRYDVVAIVEPESGEQWVKRVVGLPGEVVEYKAGQLLIDGNVMPEDFLDEAYLSSIGKEKASFTPDFTYRKLAEDEYFVLGDNRIVSKDSRAVGPFKRSDIIAKHFYIVLPFDKLRMVTDGG